MTLDTSHPLPWPSISHYQPNMVAGLGFLEQKDLEFLLRSNPDTVQKVGPSLSRPLTLDLVKEKFTKLRSEEMRRL